MLIGIPRATFQENIVSQAQEIFQKLNIDILLSPKTDKHIYNQALHISDSEFCMPLKILLSHVKEIKDKVDYVLIPNYLGDTNQFYCSLSISVADLCRNIFPGIKILEIDGSLTTYIYLSKILNKSPIEITKVYNSVELKKEYFEIDKTKKTILLVGRPYVLRDPYINNDIKKHLKEYNVNIITSEQITKDHLHKLNKSHWENTNKQISAILEGYENQEIHGIVYITPFNCGPDYLIEEFTRKFKTKPFLRLNLDEHSGDAGLKTRLEAFMEII